MHVRTRTPTHARARALSPLAPQGTILDRIDYNLEVAAERTRTGFENVKKAEEYQKSSRPIKCIAFLVVLIVILVIVLIVKKA